MERRGSLVLAWVACLGVMGCTSDVSPGLYETCARAGECTEGSCVRAQGDVTGSRMICSRSCLVSADCPDVTAPDGTVFPGFCTTASVSFPESPGTCRAGCGGSAERCESLRGGSVDEWMLGGPCWCS